MSAREEALTETGAPVDRPRHRLDVASLGPPEPLVRTLETLESLPDETVLVQVNDRVPRFLYPKLRDRGYAFETVEREEEVVTVIWRP